MPCRAYIMPTVIFAHNNTESLLVVVDAVESKMSVIPNLAKQYPRMDV